MNETEIIYAEGLVQIARWVNYLLLVGVALAVTVIIMRFLHRTTFTLGQIKFPIRKFPFVVASFSIAHLFLTWMLNQKVALIKSAGAGSSKYAWIKLMNSDAFVFHGMQRRLLEPDGGLLGLVWYAAPATDTAFWASLAFAIALMISVTISIWPKPGERLRIWPIFDALAIGCAMAAANWLIGSNWAIALSTLG